MWHSVVSSQSSKQVLFACDKYIKKTRIKKGPEDPFDISMLFQVPQDTSFKFNLKTGEFIK